MALLIAGAAAYFLVLLYLPEADRQAPSVHGVAVHLPVWAKLAVAGLLYVAPIVGYALDWGGFFDDPLEKAVGAAGFCFPLLSGALGVLFGGSLGWGIGAAVAGIPAGFVLYLVVGALLLKSGKPESAATGQREGD